MAPAGSYESLAAALRAGADSVYFGVGMFNMRARSSVNFTVEDLPKVARLCHACKAKAYLTCNVIIYDEEVEAMHELLRKAKDAGIDAVIAADLAVITYAHSIGLEVHISVQANVCNLSAVRFFAAYADVMVLARELKLSQIRTIIEGIKKEGITGENLLTTIERRLDNVAYRAGFGASRREARQLVRHGHFTVNGKKANIPSIILKVGDVVALRARSKDLARFNEAAAELEAASATLPKWLTLNVNDLSVTVNALPQRDDIDFEIEEQLIVELYSK